MKLYELTATIFCGADWRYVDIQVLASTKEEAIECFLKKCGAIHLDRTNNKMNSIELKNFVKSWKDAHRLVGGTIWDNLDFQIFKESPEKFVEFYWEEIELPKVTVS